jgi:hypothetical protein
MGIEDAAGALSLILALVPATAGLAAAPLIGLEKPLRGVRTVVKDPPSSTPGIDSVQLCFVYRDLLVIQVDTHEKGAHGLALRRVSASKSSDVDRICAARTWSGEQVLPDNEQYFAGRLGPYVFAQSADSFGGAATLWAYDAGSGKQIRAVDYYNAKPLVLRRSGDDVAVDLHQQLVTPCSFARDAATCWRKTRAENAIPDAVTIAPPDCSSLYASKDFADYPELLGNPKAVQLFAKATIPALGRAVVEYRSGPVVCVAAP